MTFHSQEHEKVYKNMQQTWIKFIGGVKSLHDFAVCLYGPVWNETILQELSENARLQIDRAKKDIDKDRKAIEKAIVCLLEERQSIEKYIDELIAKKNALYDIIKSKEEEIRKATYEIQSAERDIQVYMKKAKKGKTNTIISAVATIAVGTVGGIVGAVLIFFTAGIAAPLAVTTVTAAVSGASLIATGINQKNLNDVRESIREKKYVLKERLTDLTIEEKNMTDTKSKLIHNKSISKKLHVEHEKLLVDSKVTTKLSDCVTRCQNCINITLGRLEILSEKSKKEIFITNIKMIMEEVIQQLLSASNKQGVSSFIRPVEVMAIEIEFLRTLINIERNNEIEMSASKRCCCLFHCCICAPFSLVRCIFFGSRN